MIKNRYVLADTMNDQSKSVSAKVWKRTRDDAGYLVRSGAVIDTCKVYYISVRKPKSVTVDKVKATVVKENKTVSCKIYQSYKQALLNKQVSLAMEHIRSL